MYYARAKFHLSSFVIVHRRSLFFLVCPDGAGGLPTSRLTSQTSDWLYNMTGRNVSDWLVKTVDRFEFDFNISVFLTALIINH